MVGVNKKVFVGMSGGVDSSVSAALLHEAGFDVTGVFIKVWQPDWVECNWREERLDAMRAAAHIGIPFVTLDLEQEYKTGVIDYMIAEYKIGRTPNPDVMCNREVKFGAFWQWARSQGADYVATGHYSRVGQGNYGESTNSHSATSSSDFVVKTPSQPNFSASQSLSIPPYLPTSRVLLQGKDNNKDQSYFLWTLNQDDLAHIMFPVGDMEKSEVRKLAKKFGLPNAEKKDSQGLCFIGKLDVKEFLSHYIKPVVGNVLDQNREVIGHHSGALFFTIGERHGFTITKKTPNDDAFYVVSKDTLNNTITVSNKSIDGGHSNSRNEVRISHTNWISYNPKIGDTLQARTRYREPLVNIEIVTIQGSNASLVFKEPKDNITPGQSLVMYDGEVCVGGGVID